MRLVLPMLFTTACVGDLGPKEALQALTSVDSAQPRIDDQSSRAKEVFDKVEVNLSGISFKGDVRGDGELWTGDARVKGFIPLALDGTVAVEVGARYKDIEILDNGVVLNGHLDLETGADFSGDLVAWLLLEGSLKADDGDQVGRIDFLLDVEVANGEVTLDAVVNERDVSEEFTNGEFTSFLVYHE